MNMKLSYRDKVIFIVVIVLIILAVGFFVFVKAKIQESKDIQANLEVKQQELDEVHAKIDTLEPLKKQLKDDIKEVDELQKPFLDEQDTFEADQYIYNILSEVPNVEFLSMELSGEEANPLEAYYYEKSAVAYDLKMNADLSGDSLDQEVYDTYYKTFPPAPEGSVIAIDTVTANLLIPTGSDGLADWETVLAVFDALSNEEKTINLRTFSGDNGSSSKDGEAGKAKITVVVDVFSIHKMDTSKID